MNLEDVILSDRKHYGVGGADEGLVQSSEIE